jgi:hypothetical protein
MELLDFKSQYEQSHYKQLQWKEFLCNQTYYQLKHLPYYLITRKSLSGSYTSGGVSNFLNSCLFNPLRVDVDVGKNKSTLVAVWWQKNRGQNLLTN